ncbi:MAG: FAD-linked oxidase C-terminal domain-containing protein [Deltaproteobacteria bacterium]
MEQELKKAIIRIVGPEKFSDLLIDRVSHGYDASSHHHRPDASVWPTHTREVSELLKLAYTRRLPVTPRGAGTGLAGSAIPIRSGIVLDLCRMNRIIDIRVPDRIAIVAPGVVYQDLQKALAPYDFFFPPDPASGKACTIGGNVATNAGGLKGAKYGVTRDYVLGLEVVLADGRVMRCGSNCMKSVSGYDLTHLFVGSEGSLGVITEITLKIHPKPQAVCTASAMFDGIETAGRCVADILRSGIIPSVLEILDENTLNVLRHHSRASLPDGRAMILVETDGYTEAETRFQMERVVGVFQKRRSLAIHTARSAEESEHLWQARRIAGSVAAKLRPGNVSEDVAVPVSRIPELLKGISEIVRDHDLPFVVFGHAGDGNLHPKIMYDPTDEDEVRRMKDASDEIFNLTCRLDGTLTGEHGIGLAKAPYMRLEHDAVSLEVMSDLKTLFDPLNILNPGKMGLNHPKTRS